MVFLNVLPDLRQQVDFSVAKEDLELLILSSTRGVRGLQATPLHPVYTALEMDLRAFNMLREHSYHLA